MKAAPKRRKPAATDDLPGGAVSSEYDPRVSLVPTVPFAASVTAAGLDAVLVEVLPVHDQAEAAVGIQTLRVGWLLAVLDTGVAGFHKFRESEPDVVDVLGLWLRRVGPGS
ncbi:hypothetical protein HNQ79_006343 [Streptomyces candidus]|uniref:Uncharacterized protein n=1 Tax=Streptomyces candidus TaxID=67283 RepID=A0A7X0LU86_9ACTN|nr:hypothetical protein [Streptomyces candidus]GHH57080.1 hypothetical protein GCM10018773_63920 [Streptomyces candidus]